MNIESECRISSKNEWLLHEYTSLILIFKIKVFTDDILINFNPNDNNLQYIFILITKHDDYYFIMACIDTFLLVCNYSILPKQFHFNIISIKFKINKLQINFAYDIIDLNTTNVTSEDLIRAENIIKSHAMMMRTISEKPLLSIKGLNDDSTPRIGSCLTKRLLLISDIIITFDQYNHDILKVFNFNQTCNVLKVSNITIEDNNQLNIIWITLSLLIVFIVGLILILRNGPKKKSNTIKTISYDITPLNLTMTSSIVLQLD